MKGKFKDFKKTWITVIFIFFILLPKTYLLLKVDYCLWHEKDCDWYYNSINNVTPEKGLFYFLIRLLRLPVMLIGYEATIKIFLLVTSFIFLFGIYLFLKDELDFELILFAILSANFILGMTRIWIELYRNMFLMMLVPYLFYYIKKERPVSSGLILGTILISHHTGIIFIPLVVLYYIILKEKSSLRGKKWKDFLIIFFMVFLILYTYYSTIYPIEKDYSGDVRFLDEFLTTVGNQYLEYNIDRLFYFNSIYLITAFLALCFSDRKNKTVLLTGIFFILCLSTLYFEAGHRLMYNVSFPSVILTSFYLQKRDKGTRKFFLMLFALFLAECIAFYIVRFPTAIITYPPLL